MFETRGDKGKNKINLAKETFNKIVLDLQEGIEHCNAEVSRHTAIIQESEEEIKTLETAIEYANRIQGNVKQIIE